jgi:hypothetical protein
MRWRRREGGREGGRERGREGGKGGERERGRERESSSRETSMCARRKRGVHVCGGAADVAVAKDPEGATAQLPHREPVPRPDTAAPARSAARPRAAAPAGAGRGGNGFEGPVGAPGGLIGEPSREVLGEVARGEQRVLGERVRKDPLCVGHLLPPPSQRHFPTPSQGGGASTLNHSHRISEVAPRAPAAAGPTRATPSGPPRSPQARARR